MEDKTMKNFIKGIKNCMKSSLFWSMTTLSFAGLGLPAWACIIGIRNGLTDGWSEHDIIMRAMLGVVFGVVFGVCEWAIIMTAKECKN